MSYWNNRFLSYMQNYFKKRRIETVAHVGTKLKFRDVYPEDIMVFCWANEHVIELSKQEKVCSKYIVFIRSYEIYSGLINKINWKNVDDVIFVSKAFYNALKDHIPSRCHWIPNGIDLSMWGLQEHGPGKRIAMVSSINHKKGFQIVPPFMRRLCNIDSQYELHIAGEMQEIRFEVYLKHILGEMGLLENVHFHGPVRNISDFLYDKSYILSTSITEGCPNNILEAMACGVKPVIHNWPGAKDLFPEELVWTDISEGIDIITEDKYDNLGYRQFIQNNYDCGLVYGDLERLVCGELQEVQA